MSKGLSPPVLAQRWENDLETRSDMSIKGKRKLHDMRIIGGGLRECEVRSNPYNRNIDNRFIIGLTS